MNHLEQVAWTTVLVFVLFEVLICMVRVRVRVVFFFFFFFCIFRDVTLCRGAKRRRISVCD